MENNPILSFGLSLRLAEPTDAAEVIRLIRQMGPDSEINEDYVLHYLSGTERGVLLACIGEHVAGLLSYSLRADLYHAGISVLIEELVVESGARGRGIGSALMDELLKRVEEMGCKELCLAVMPENEAAIRFYRRHGLLEEALFLERHFHN